MNDLLAAERGRRNLRVALFVIIVATLPFYCFGIILLTNPASRSAINAPLATNTRAAEANTARPFASVTPLPRQDNLPTLVPTPDQFFPTIVRFITPTFVFPTFEPTAFIFPTDTIAPSLTQFPSITPFPTVTNTTIPLPTDTAIPLPTETIKPDFSETPTETPTVFPP